MSKTKSPTPPPKSPPLDESSYFEDVKVVVDPSINQPVERNTEAVSALANAPPYLLSRAETMMVAYRHTLGHVVPPFANLSVIERAAWLAVARSVES